ncbi:MAG: tetratricopeptide repeat protein, partial [Paludibacteraceae bacterium]|nr:tetratricopeptide repeat protein [Paludibacteraceae bacterium]
MMKKGILSIFFVLLAALAFAGQDKLNEANAKYKDGDFASAVSLYEEALKSGESATLYYNLGCAYYKLGKLGPAILNYERALLLDPHNEDTKYNLELLEKQTVDKIEAIDTF